jgi:hypothetical protein
MNTKETSGYLKFLRGIPSLGFDSRLVGDYLDCFQSDTTRAQVIDELKALYEDLAGKEDRLAMMEVIGSPHASFDEDDKDFEEGWEIEPGEE